MVSNTIGSFVVTAEEMQRIEARIFAAGMPVSALMEKVSGRIVQWFLSHDQGIAFATDRARRKIGVLAGPGHNGGDALVIARELHHLGFSIRVYQPFSHCKPLTEQQANYAKSLGIPFVESVEDLVDCEAVIDGWFGFGLTRLITGDLAADINTINQQSDQQSRPVFSIDLPSGIHTDTGEIMGSAIRATHTACLGLWKRAFMQESALDYLGNSELILFDIPFADIAAVLGETPTVQRLTSTAALSYLPLNRSLTAHKYKAGHLLLIAGSKQYAGAALLSGLAAIASGVGMLTLAIPESIRLALLPQLPGALLVGCSETSEGAIAHLPDSLDLTKYDAIALGPGLTRSSPNLLSHVLAAACPLLLDADGLNLLAQSNPIQQLQARSAPTVLTPHAGEFKRLFPNLHSSNHQPGDLARQAAEASKATILLKGARSAIATSSDLSTHLWFNPDSTPALARGGSGDILTGLMGGLMATAHQTQKNDDNQTQSNPDALTKAVLSAVWWHSQAALYASTQRTILGVDPLHLAQSLNPALKTLL